MSPTRADFLARPRPRRRRLSSQAAATLTAAAAVVAEAMAEAALAAAMAAAASGSLVWVSGLLAEAKLSKVQSNNSLHKYTSQFLVIEAQIESQSLLVRSARSSSGKPYRPFNCRRRFSLDSSTFKLCRPRFLFSTF